MVVFNNSEIVKISLFAGMMKTRQMLVYFILCERSNKILEDLSESWQAYQRQLTPTHFLIHAS